MWKTLGVRFVQMAVLFVIFISILFFVVQLSPGDPSAKFIGNPNIPPEARQQLVEAFGFDQPLHVQYFKYMGNFFTGDLGVSFSNYPKPVMTIIKERLPRTIVLLTGATLLAYYFGFLLGKVLAWRRGTATEYGTTIVGVFLYTVFYPWFAIINIWLFAFIVPRWFESVIGFELGFPTGKFLNPAVWRGTDFGANDVFFRMIASVGLALVGLAVAKLLTKRFRYNAALERGIGIGGTALVLVGFVGYWAPHRMLRYALDIVYHTALPTLVLTAIVFGGVMLLMRTSMLETLREDYILTARAKGLREKDVRDRHAARNALMPVVTSLTLALATVIGGAIVTETVFAWPGMGEALLLSAVAGDHPVVIGTLAFVGVLALLGHLVVDILYAYLDPRIRYE